MDDGLLSVILPTASTLIQQMDENPDTHLLLMMLPFVSWLLPIGWARIHLLHSILSLRVELRVVPVVCL